MNPNDKRENMNRTLRLHLGVFVAILAASKLGTLLLLTRGTVVCPFWPAGGVELFMVLRFGTRVWPALFAAELAGNLTAGDANLFAWIAPFFNLAETLTAATLIRIFRVDTALRSSKAILRFAIGAPWIPPIFSAAGGTILLCASGEAPWSGWAGSFKLWWLANALGILVVTPALLTLTRSERDSPRHWKTLVAGLGVFLIGMALTLLGESHCPDIRLIGPLLAIFVGIGLGTSIGIGGAAAAVAMTGYCGATAAGYGFFVRGDAETEAVLLAGYALALSVTLLPLGAVVEALKLSKLRTELALRAGRIRLWEWRRGGGATFPGEETPAALPAALDTALASGKESGEVALPDGATWAYTGVRLASGPAGTERLTGVALDTTAEREAERAKLSRAVLEARLHSLRSFLDPHLLFNALTGLRATVRENPEAALEYIADLSRFLRLSLDASGTPEHPLEAELALARAFLNFHRHRCDLAPVVLLPKPSPRTAASGVPPGILHTLLENALKFGERDADGTLRVTVGVGERGSEWTLSVAHAGGLDTGRAHSGKPGGLRCLREQIAILHGEACRLDIREDIPGTVVTEAVFPLNPTDAND